VRGLFLPELLLRRDERGGLVRQASPQPLGLPGLLLGLTLPGPRSLKGCAFLPELGTSRGHLRLPLYRHGARPRQIFSRPPQRFVPVDERRAHLLDGGGPPLRTDLPTPGVGPAGLPPGTTATRRLSLGPRRGRRGRRAAPGAGGAHLVEGANLTLARSSSSCRRRMKTKKHRSREARARGKRKGKNHQTQ
jgi:hypothetical protein